MTLVKPEGLESSVSLAYQQADGDPELAKRILAEDRELDRQRFAREWFEDWCAVWAAIGWLASTDNLQMQLVGAVLKLATTTRSTAGELQREVDNLRVAVEWLRRKTQ